jgi:hypothetical protein
MCVAAFCFLAHSAKLLLSSRTRTLRSEIISLTRQAEAFNSPDTFARYAKLRREIEKKRAILGIQICTSFLNTLEQNSEGSSPLLKYIKVDVTLRVMGTLFVFSYWGRTKILVIPGNMLYPLVTSLTSLLWFVVCYSIAKWLLEFAAAFSAPAPARRKTE